MPVEGNESCSHRQIMIQWRIGCSGYHYPEWRGIFYPLDVPKKNWFEFYTQHFNTIELNTTFYRFPRLEIMKGWYERAPADFSFSVKAPRLITHLKKLKEAQRYLADFYDIVREGLQEKVACVLFQFPADFSFGEERLERIASLLDTSFRNVVEFRNQSWWCQQVFRTLEHKGIIFAGMSHPSLSEQVIRTTKHVYYRFHGVPHLYTSRYGLPKLDQVVHEIQSFEAVEEGYLYFNNTAEGAAIENAREIQEIAACVH